MLPQSLEHKAISDECEKSPSLVRRPISNYRTESRKGGSGIFE